MDCRGGQAGNGQQSGGNEQIGMIAPRCSKPT